MEIVVKSRHCEISERFREHVREKLIRLDKYDQSKRIIRVDVEVDVEHNPRQADRACRVELTVRSRGPVIRAEAACEDKMAALDAAIDKLEARLRRAVDRRRIHHGNRTPVSVAEATARAEHADAMARLDGQPAGSRATTAVEERPAVETHREGPLEVMGDGPLVVREKTHDADPMTLDQALYEMEMVGHDFYLFIDAATGAPSVVYRRRGYDYGVIHLSAA
ncbi:MAG: ribosome-associated translation inhibitor RaiA [Nocardioidaceae bacterium]|nr:ribosome-associated translation inhibitor RaiA [Nocardioidaceae bacterium]